MANLVQTSLAPGGVITPTEVTLTASDTITWPKRKPGAILILRNPTGGALSPIITGSEAGVENVPGYGTVNAGSGLAVGSIPAGATRIIPLESRKAFLKGALTITNGTGLIATLLTP